MTTSISANDTTFLAFLQHFVDSPISMTIFFFLVWISFLVYKDKLGSLVSAIASVWPNKRNKKSKYTKATLLKHPLFSDFDFWINYRVPQLYDPENNKAKDKAKLMIAKDMLIIKFRCAKTFLTEFVEEVDGFAENESSSRLQFHLEKYKSIQYAEYKKAGIPSLFIEKWLEVHRIRDAYLDKVMTALVSDSIDLPLYEKVNILLSDFSLYFFAHLLEMARVVDSINGDLRGEVYKGEVIGGNEYKFYPVPDKEYVPIVNKHLHELAEFTKASVVSVFYLHDVNGDDYINGSISKLYGYSTSARISLYENVQFMHGGMLDGLLTNLKQHEGFSSAVSELNPMLASKLNEIGAAGFVAYPMFLHNKLCGVLTLTYCTETSYNAIDTKKTFEMLKRYSALLNLYLDYTKNGLDYSQHIINRVLPEPNI